MTRNDQDGNMRIRPEMPGDAAVIAAVTQAAFAKAAHSSGTEATIVDSLRRAGALTIALVAEANGEVVGHIAFSPITVEARNAGWFGLGPVSVVPDLQGQGIGSRLVREGLDLLRAQGARGCVVLGDPRFYERFGFRVDPRLRYAGVPPEYFMAQGFGQEVPEGTVAYHPSFDTH